MTIRRLLSIAVLLAVPATARPEPCIHLGPPQTIRQFADSAFIVFVRAVNDPKDGDQRDATFLVIRDVLKDDPIIARRQMLRIKNRIDIKDSNNPPSLVVFGDVFKGETDVFKGLWGGPHLAEYVRGLLAVAPKGNVEVVRYCFDHVDSPEPEVAKDAFTELVGASAADIRLAAPKFKPAKLRRSLADEKTPTVKLSLFAFLLGHCGEREDAALIRAVLDRQVKKAETQGLDGLCVGYTLLDPANGWAKVRELAGGANEFPVRYAALRTARFFQVRPGVIARKDLLGLIDMFLDQDDIADLAVEDLRQWRCWDLTERVLALADMPKFPIVHRAVLRYSIQCPDKRCKAHVAKQRERNPDKVKDAQELLDLEDGSDRKLN
jgi:hypothetical protein